MRIRRIIYGALCLLLCAGCTGLQRKFLFYPTHHSGSRGLSLWEKGGKLIG